MAARIIPGVDVRVIREIVPPLPAPSGILALVGVAERETHRLRHVDSFSSFKEIHGSATSFSIPEARQAFLNGIFEVVVSPVGGGSKASLTLNDADDEPLVILQARSAGSWANKNVKVNVENRSGSVDIALRYGDREEKFTNLDMSYQSRGYFFDVINRRSELVVAVDPHQALPHASDATKDLQFNQPSQGKNAWRRLVGSNGREVVELIARNSELGQPGNPLSADLLPDAGGSTVTLVVKSASKTETFANVSMDPTHERYLVFLLQDTPTSLVTAIDLPLAPNDPQLPVSVQGELDGGSLPNAAQYEEAIGRLEKDPTIDLILASLQDSSDIAFVKGVHSAVNSHCLSASESGYNRFGVGGIPSAINSELAEIVAMAGLLNSDHFALAAPSGVSGAVAGLIGGLDFFRSPTFKTLRGLVDLPVDYATSDIRQLILGNVLTVDFLDGRGFIVVKGIDTSGGQISVTRVADRAVRRVKAISDQFIGTLNSADGRNALRQRIVEFLTQLEKDGAIVPSTDGSQPAFEVDVYSSQADFSQGIVRVDIAIRPVRAIDFIYATILVKV